MPVSRAAPADDRPAPLSGGVEEVVRPPLHVIFEQYAPFVWRVLRRTGVPEADVEDVCQEVFIAIDKQLPRFDGRSSLRTWIYAIAVRRAISHHRRPVRHYERATDVTPEQAIDAEQMAQIDTRRAAAALDALLDRMDRDRRLVFVLYELEQLPMREVAAVLGCPLQTAYGRLHAAREELRQLARAMGVIT